MKNSMLEKTTLVTGSDKDTKAPYAKPVLRTFGSVKSLTKGGGGSRIDGNGPSKDQGGL
jgi:hypothetical protein